MEFIKDLSAIRQKLDSLKQQGYDRIHIPGGTSKDGSHYSGTVIHSFDIVSKEVYFVGVPYDSSFHKHGDEKNGHTKKFDERPIETGVREALEETALSILPEDLELLKKSSYNIPDNKDSNKRHYKYFYSAYKFTGSLFTFEGRNPIDPETGPPLWIPASLFVRVVFAKHLPAVKEVIEKLRTINTEYYFALANV